LISKAIQTMISIDHNGKLENLVCRNIINKGHYVLFQTNIWFSY